MPLRRKYKKPKLPKGQIVLHDPSLTVEEAVKAEQYDGPYESGDVAYDNDGATELLSSGWPYKLPVIRQRGDVLELPKGVKLQVSLWQ